MLITDRETSDLRVEIATLQSAGSLHERKVSSLQGEIERVTAANEKMADTLTDTDRRANQLEQSNEQLKSELKRAETELSDYKYKATTVLQSKEKVITTLREQLSQPVKVLYRNLTELKCLMTIYL